MSQIFHISVFHIKSNSLIASVCCCILSEMWDLDTKMSNRSKRNPVQLYRYGGHQLTSQYPSRSYLNALRAQPINVPARLHPSTRRWKCRAIFELFHWLSVRGAIGMGPYHAPWMAATDLAGWMFPLFLNCEWDISVMWCDMSEPSVPAIKLSGIFTIWVAREAWSNGKGGHLLRR